MERTLGRHKPARFFERPLIERRKHEAMPLCLLQILLIDEDRGLARATNDVHLEVHVANPVGIELHRSVHVGVRSDRRAVGAVVVVNEAPAPFADFGPGVIEGEAMTKSRSNRSCVRAVA